MYDKIRFEVLGQPVEYQVNNAGTHEMLSFGTTCLVDVSGDVGPYRTPAWKRTFILSGAAQAQARRKVLRAHAENMLALELVRFTWLRSVENDTNACTEGR